MATRTKPDFKPLTSTVGAVVEGVDITAPLDDETVATLRQALLDRGVLFFREQALTDALMHEFVAQFAEPICEPFASAMNSDSEPVSTGDLSRTRNSTAVWHTDTTFVPEPPGMTALRAVELPDVGGDTCWLSSYATYEALSEPMREMLDGLHAVHSMMPTLGRMGMQDAAAHSGNESTYGATVAHPLVRVHPETGRKALYYSEAGVVDIVELNPAEAEHVLALLREHVKSPQFQMRWQWTVNDVALWDNRGVQHFAVPDYEGTRVMQRVVTAGGKPVGPSD